MHESHEPDHSLAIALRGKLKDFSKDRERRAREHLDDYATACHLSRGPDQGRSEHWAQKARELERLMRGMLGDDKEEDKSARGCGKGKRERDDDEQKDPL